VAAPEDLGVRPPGAVRGHHHRARMLPVDAQPGVPEVVVGGVGGRYRADPGPGAGRGVEPPDVAVAAVVGAALVAGGEVQPAGAGVQHTLVRDEPGRLPGQPCPGSAAVRRAVDGVLQVGHTDVDGLGELAGGARALVEGDPDHALVVAGVPV